MRQALSRLFAVLGMVALFPFGSFTSIASAAYPTSFVYEAEDMPTVVGYKQFYSGSPSLAVMRADASSLTPGYVVYGPYTNDQLPSKRYRATFRVRALTTTTQPIAQLEVNNYGGNLINDRKLFIEDFTGVGQFTDFNLDFTRPISGSMEYRVYFYANTDVEVDKITVTEITPTDAITYESENLRRQVGNVVTDPSASNGKAVLVLSSEHAVAGEDYLQYGPYSVDQDINNTFKATFRLKVSDNTSASNVARIDAYNAWGNGEWTYRHLKGTDFTTANTYQDFSINHQRINEGTMEYRIVVYGVTDVTTDYVKVEKITQSTNSYESENLSSSAGTIVADPDASSGQARQATSVQPGYLQYGPYTVEQAPGSGYQATFSLSVSNNTLSTPVARIEASNFGGDGDWRYRVIKANDFLASNKYQDFTVNFTRTNSGTMEYRVYILGNTDSITVRSDKVDVYKSYDNNWTYEAENSYSTTGNLMSDPSASGSKAREATTTSNTSGYMVYGPYSDDQPANQIYTATFTLKTRNNSTTSNVARIEVSNPGGTGAFVSKEITGNQFTANNTYQDFSINFARGEAGNMEFRVWFYDVADIIVDKTVVTPFNSDSVTYLASEQPRQVGTIITDAQAQNGTAVKATKGTGAGYVSYGPYTIEQSPGNYQVTYRIKRGSNATTNSPLVRLEINNNDGTGQYVENSYNLNDINTTYTDFTLNFYRTGEGNMEYRVYTFDLADITVDKITVTKI